MNVLVRSGSLVPKFACQPVVIPDTFHLPLEITVGEPTPRRAPAPGSARAVSARTKRLNTAASLDMTGDRPDRTERLWLNYDEDGKKLSQQ